MIKNTLKTLVAALVLASSAAALANNPPPTVKADAPNRYIVKKGDTLWDISGKYLDAPYRWREIWATNKQIKNPNLIYPNDVLILCIIRGQTLVGVDTGEGCAGIEKQMDTAPSSVAITSTANSIPAIPLTSIRHWLSRSVIVRPQDFDTTPYVLASKEGNLITSVGNKIYIKGAPLIAGQRYGIYRKGQPYIDQRTGTTIGLEVTQVAAGTVSSVAANGVSSLNIAETYGSEVREGDRVFVEVDAPIPSVFYPAPAEVNRGGMIARVMGGISSAAKDSVVAINLGAADGAQPGYILDVYKKGALVRDIRDNDTPVRLPSELAGQVMVFKTFDNISYAYVLAAEVPLDVGDFLVAPEIYQ
ncbi:MAG: LysM peptidoglycan-binding domain-containing protein [Moraxella sp.]|nr:LysM peptidoglycan-binding domain-containing protein [Moraxella sp.]